MRISDKEERYNTKQLKTLKNQDKGKSVNKVTSWVILSTIAQYLVQKKLRVHRVILSNNAWSMPQPQK